MPRLLSGASCGFQRCVNPEGYELNSADACRYILHLLYVDATNMADVPLHIQPPKLSTSPISYTRTPYLRPRSPHPPTISPPPHLGSLSTLGGIKRWCNDRFCVSSIPRNRPQHHRTLHRLEVDLSCLLQNFTSAPKIGLCLAAYATLFIELGKVDIKSVEVCGGFPRVDGRQCIRVSLCDL